MAGAVGVVLGAGSGTRVGAGVNKVYLPVLGRPLVAWSLAAFTAAPAVGRVLLVVRADEVDAARALAAAEVDGPVEVVVGGASRHASERAALQHLRADIVAGTLDVVAIHDGARPLVSTALIGDVVAAARLHGGAVPAVPLDDVARTSATGAPADDVLPNRVVRVQTPQAFRAEALLEAYDRAELDGFAGTDTAMCLERYSSLDVRCVTGSARNVKVTFAGDLGLVERLLTEQGARVD